MVLESLERGRHVILEQAHILNPCPGVYRMLGEYDEVLYIGKAKNLKKRVMSYTRTDSLPLRLKRMVSATHAMAFMTTRSEEEALLLEASLIKSLRPHYNVLLKDDKAVPELLIRTDASFPQALKHRGVRNEKGLYFGPFASRGVVGHTLVVLQKAFHLRSCSDEEMEKRTRPCLLYHIKRCSAPCMGLISKEAYASRVQEATLFLKGKHHKVQRLLLAQMEASSKALAFEEAASLRDRLRALKSVHIHGDIATHGVHHADVFSAFEKGGSVCVEVLFFRGGVSYGNQTYFPKGGDLPLESVLRMFIGQFYVTRSLPPLILTSHLLTEASLLQKALTLHRGAPVRVVHPQRGPKSSLILGALRNVEAALERELAKKAHQHQRMKSLEALLGRSISRIEVYDNSHMQGAFPVGAMIVAHTQGFARGSYRLFNIKELVEGRNQDDYHMMEEVLSRRLRGVKEDSPLLPDVMILDGGVGQLEKGYQVLCHHGLERRITLLGVAKGPHRHAGREVLHRRGHPPLKLPRNDPLLYLIQQLRDEAHRYVIGAHRKRRHKALRSSRLDDVPGVGPKRKKALLIHFGSAHTIAQASLKELEMVEGISRSLAQVIYQYLHREA